MTTSWFFHQFNKFSVLNYDTVHSFFHLPSLLQAHPSPRKVICLPSGRAASNKMVSQHIVGYQPHFFRIHLKDFWCHISVNSLGLYLSPEYFLNFLPNLYIPPLLWKFFKFILFRLLKNAFGSQKIESRHFFSWPQVEIF